jgi:formate-dependent nitrite reductase membrane component NrfD
MFDIDIYLPSNTTVTNMNGTSLFMTMMEISMLGISIPQLVLRIVNQQCEMTRYSIITAICSLQGKQLVADRAFHSHMHFSC